MAGPSLEALYQDLLTGVGLALDVPEAALPRYAWMRAALLDARASVAATVIHRALAPGADVAAETGRLRDGLAGLPIRYTPLCRRCREHPCGCCRGCGWAPDERCEECGDCGCHDTRCPGGHQDDDGHEPQEDER